MKKIKNYLINLPLRTLFRINSLVILGFIIYIVFLNNKIKDPGIFFLIITPLIWTGCTFFFLTLLIQFLNQNPPKTFLNRMAIVLVYVTIFISFFGPIVGYFIAKHYYLEGEQIKQAMHHT